MDKKPLQDVYDDDRGFWDKFSRPYGSKGAPVTPYQELRGQHSSTATPVRNRDTTKISSTKELNAIVNNTEKTVKILERVASTLLSVSTSMDEVKKALGNVSRVASSESSAENIKNLESEERISTKESQKSGGYSVPNPLHIAANPEGFGASVVSKIMDGVVQGIAEGFMLKKFGGVGGLVKSLGIGLIAFELINSIVNEFKGTFDDYLKKNNVSKEQAEVGLGAAGLGVAGLSMAGRSANKGNGKAIASKQKEADKLSKQADKLTKESDKAMEKALKMDSKVNPTSFDNVKSNSALNKAAELEAKAATKKSGAEAAKLAAEELAKKEGGKGLLKAVGKFGEKLLPGANIGINLLSAKEEGDEEQEAISNGDLTTARLKNWEKITSYTAAGGATAEIAGAAATAPAGGLGGVPGAVVNIGASVANLGLHGIEAVTTKEQQASMFNFYDKMKDKVGSWFSSDDNKNPETEKEKDTINNTSATDANTKAIKDLDAHLSTMLNRKDIELINHTLNDKTVGLMQTGDVTHNITSNSNQTHSVVNNNSGGDTYNYFNSTGAQSHHPLSAIA